MTPPNIHPTAIVHPKAMLDSSVQVGAYSVIGEHVQIDAGTHLASHVVVDGHTTIGKHNQISQFTSLGAAPQDKKYQGEPTRLEIGHHNTIREFCTFNRGTMQDKGVTKVGDHNWLMACVHIAHDCVVGHHTILANNASLAGHVEIGDYTFLGGYTLVHQFCKVGSYVITAASAVVFQDIPPYMMTSGGFGARPITVNVEGLKRHGFSASSISNIKRAYKILYRQGNSLEQACAEIKAMQSSVPELTLLLSFIRASQRRLAR